MSSTNEAISARKFHELNQAYELLLDPLRRLALDAKLRIKEARKTRFKSFDNKRKVLVEELEEREKAFKKARVEKQEEEVKRWHDTEQIKDEGRRLREEKEKALKAREMDKQNAIRQHTANVDLDEPPAIRASLVLSNNTYSIRHRTKRHNSSCEVLLVGSTGAHYKGVSFLTVKPIRTYRYRNYRTFLESFQESIKQRSHNGHRSGTFQKDR